MTDPMKLNNIQQALRALPDDVQRKAILSVILERMRQDQKWGEQNHSPEKWLMILAEEIGEFSRAHMNKNKANIRPELVQVVAVGLVMLECCDRNGWGR